MRSTIRCADREKRISPSFVSGRARRMGSASPCPIGRRIRRRVSNLREALRAVRIAVTAASRSSLVTRGLPLEGGENRLEPVHLIAARLRGKRRSLAQERPTDRAWPKGYGWGLARETFGGSVGTTAFRGRVIGLTISPQGHRNANGVDDTDWFDLALHLGLRSCRVDRRVRHGISEGRQGRYQGENPQSRAGARWRVGDSAGHDGGAGQVACPPSRRRS
jgi:hypothetical protein